MRRAQRAKNEKTSRGLSARGQQALDEATDSVEFPTDVRLDIVCVVIQTSSLWQYAFTNKTCFIYLGVSDIHLKFY